MTDDGRIVTLPAGMLDDVAGGKGLGVDPNGG
jgi:hypothetical protein